MSGVDFEDADLSDFNFERADLRNAKWENCKSFPKDASFALLGRGSAAILATDFERLVKVCTTAPRWSDRFFAFGMITTNFGCTQMVFELLNEVVREDRSTYMRLCSLLYFSGEVLHHREFQMVCEKMAERGNAKINIFQLKKVRRFLEEAVRYFEVTKNRSPKFPNEVELGQLRELLLSKSQ